MEIEELKNIWKEQKKGDIKLSDESFASIIDALKKNERKVIRRFLLMTFFMTYAAYFFVSRMLSAKHYMTLTYVGFGLILISMSVIFIMNWSTVISFRFKNITSPSMEFIKLTRDKLARRRFIRKTIIPVYLAAIAAGITFIFLDVLSGLSITERILFHGVSYILIFGLSIFAIKRHNKRNEKEIKPVEDKINAILESE